MEDDAFEIQIQFSNLLTSITATQNSITKASSFALKYSTLSDALYPCLIEHLQKAKINRRMNLFCLIDSIVQKEDKSQVSEYTQLILNDLPLILSLVTPLDGTGNVNILNVRKILNIWKTKGILQLSDEELNQYLVSDTDVSTSLSKQQILQRMEEDRERHKKQKEEIWIQHELPDGSTLQFEDYWQTIPPMDFNFETID